MYLYHGYVLYRKPPFGDGVVNLWVTSWVGLAANDDEAKGKLIREVEEENPGRDTWVVLRATAYPIPDDQLSVAYGEMVRRKGG